MSTRGCIARTNDGGKTFSGVYHHWDSYPKGLGKTLHELYHDHFNRDLPGMLKAIIDDHPAGWSTINGHDWSKLPGFREHNTSTCCKVIRTNLRGDVLCGVMVMDHYAQNYKDRLNELEVILGSLQPAKAARIREGREFLLFDHSPQAPPDEEFGPQCYCHGDRSEKGHVITEQNASASGCEYVYAFDETERMLYILSSYCDPEGDLAGHKMIGAFGRGDDKGVWKVIGTVRLDGAVDNLTWEIINGAA